MKIVIVFVIFLLAAAECVGQLVRRVDYDAAFALQVGGDIGMLVPFGSNPGIFVRPTGGIKMTFPFTRKWFLGSEINYSELKYKSTYQVGTSGNVAADFDMKQIQVPVYLKYMLNSNRASILFGVYGTYVFDAGLKSVLSGGEMAQEESTDFSSNMDNWNAGLTIGYEYRIMKRLHAMFRVSAGAKEVMKKQSGWRKTLLPLQASLTLGFDILRIGDCGCD